MDKVLAREVNRRIHRLTATSAEPQEYVCECGRVDCDCSVPLSSDEFEAIAVHPRRLVLSPEHGRGREYAAVHALR